MTKKAKKYSAVIAEPTTGEVVSELNFVIIPRKAKFSENYMVVFQNRLLDIALLSRPQESNALGNKRERLGVEALGMLFYLLSKTEFGNRIGVCRKEIEEELEMSQSNVSRALKILESHHLIKLSNGSINLDMSVGWRGKVKDFNS